MIGAGVEGAGPGAGGAKAKRTSRRALRERILPQVARILVERPSDDLNMQAIARLTETSLWALRYHFDSYAGLVRAAALHVIEEAEAALFFFRPKPDSVTDAIRHYAASLREVMKSDAYRSMLFLVLRHGPAHNWLREAYDRRIVDRICQDLSGLVLEVSERLGAPVLFREGVTRRFQRRIETEFALRGLLSPLDLLSAEEGDAVLKDVVREAFIGTYCFDWQTPDAA